MAEAGAGLPKGQICHFTAVSRGQLPWKPLSPHGNSQDGKSTKFLPRLRERIEIPKYRQGARRKHWMDEQSSRRGGGASAPAEMPTSASPAFCSWHLSVWLAPPPPLVLQLFAAVRHPGHHWAHLWTLLDPLSSDKKSGLGILRAKSLKMLACFGMLASHTPSLNLCCCSLHENKSSSSARWEVDSVSCRVKSAINERVMQGGSSNFFLFLVTQKDLLIFQVFWKY